MASDVTRIVGNLQLSFFLCVIVASLLREGAIGLGDFFGS